MTRLLLDLEIDAACWEYLAQRIVARGGSRPPQPIVAVLDAAPEDDDWDELTAKIRPYLPEVGQRTFVEQTEAMLARMEE